MGNYLKTMHNNGPCKGFQREHAVLHQYLLHMVCFT